MVYKGTISTGATKKVLSIELCNSERKNKNVLDAGLDEPAREDGGAPTIERRGVDILNYYYYYYYYK